MEAPDLVAHLHRRLLVLLSGELHRPIQGLPQGAKLFQHRLTTSTRRRLRELDAAFGIIRHITAEKNAFFLDKVNMELMSSQSRSASAMASASTPVAPITFDIASDTDEADGISSTPQSPRPGTSSVCSRASTICDARDDDAASVSFQGVAAQASTSLVSTEAQTVLDSGNCFVQSDPHALIDIAVINSCAVIAHNMRARFDARQDLFDQACPAEHEAYNGGPAALLVAAPVVELPVDRPFIDVCRSGLLRLLIRWNHFLAEFPTPHAQDWCYDDFIVDILIPAFDGLHTLLRLTHQQWYMPRLVLLDQVALRITMGPRTWFEQLSVNSSMLDEWQLPASLDQVHILSYILARLQLVDD